MADKKKGSALEVQRVMELDTRAFSDKEYNVLLPDHGIITAVSDIMPIYVTYVELDVEKAHHMGYGKYMPSHSQLMTLSSAAGVEWLVSEEVPTEIPGVIKHVAQARYTKPNGQIITSPPCSYVLDLRPGGALEGQLWEQKSKSLHDKLPDLPRELKGFKGKLDTEEFETAKDIYLELQVRRDMAMWKRHAWARAESGAMNRVLRKLFGMPTTYEKHEYEKLWVVATAKISYEDMLKQADRTGLLQQFLAQQQDAAFGALFGGLLAQPAPAQAPVEMQEVVTEEAPAPAAESKIIEGEHEVIETKPEEAKPPPPKKPEPPPKPDKPPKAEKKAKEKGVDPADYDRKLSAGARKTTLKRLAPLGIETWMNAQSFGRTHFGTAFAWGKITILQAANMVALAEHAVKAKLTTDEIAEAAVKMVEAYKERRVVTYEPTK